MLGTKTQPRTGHEAGDAAAANQHPSRPAKVAKSGLNRWGRVILQNAKQARLETISKLVADITVVLNNFYYRRRWES